MVCAVPGARQTWCAKHGCRLDRVHQERANALRWQGLHLNAKREIRVSFVLKQALKVTMGTWL